jgi:hypothetical protein
VSIDTPGEQISSFGHACDGQAAFGDDCARPASQGTPVSLRESRAARFSELRRWRHFGYAPDAEAMKTSGWLPESTRNTAGERA